MKKIHYGFFQIGLVILVASALAAGLLINKINFNQLSAAPGCNDHPDKCKATETCVNNVCKPKGGTGGGSTGDNTTSGSGCKTHTTSSSCESSCSPVKGTDNKQFECKWISGECKEGAQVCGGTSTTGNPDTIGCDPSKEQYVNYNGQTYAYCGGCVNTCVRQDLLSGGCNAYVGAKCGTGGFGKCNDIKTSSVTTYYCEGNSRGSEVDAPCNRKDPLPGGVHFDLATHSLVGHFCGTVQADDGKGNFCSRTDTSGCHTSTPTPKPTPTKSPTPTPTPTKTPTPTPTRTPTPTPTKTPKPTRTPKSTPTPTMTSTPTPTPNEISRLKICKFNDNNGDGVINENDGTMTWNFVYSFQGKDYHVGSQWWNIISRGCRTVTVPANQWINVSEENRTGWDLTNILSDGNSVGGSSFSYVSYANTQKEVSFLNHNVVNTTPTPTPTETPTPTGVPNYCGGTCGSNSNCQGGLFCYQGYCRNPACQSESSCNCPGATATPTAPPVLGATAPPVLPKTGADDIQMVAGLLGIMGGGFFLFRKFRLI